MSLNEILDREDYPGDYGDYGGDYPTSSSKAPPTSGGSYECGKPVSNRIVGGKEATPFSIPWQVGLVHTGQKSPFCGGTLISPRHVMTAAHCTESKAKHQDFFIANIFCAILVFYSMTESIQT